LFFVRALSKVLCKHRHTVEGLPNSSLYVQFPRGIQGGRGKLNFEDKLTTILCRNREPSTELRFSSYKLESVCLSEVPKGLRAFRDHFFLSDYCI
jgi:hypothetical protein